MQTYSSPAPPDCVFAAPDKPTLITTRSTNGLTATQLNKTPTAQDKKKGDFSERIQTRKKLLSALARLVRRLLLLSPIDTDLPLQHSNVCKLSTPPCSPDQLISQDLKQGEQRSLLPLTAPPASSLKPHATGTTTNSLMGRGSFLTPHPVTNVCSPPQSPPGLASPALRPTPIAEPPRPCPIRTRPHPFAPALPWRQPAPSQVQRNPFSVGPGQTLCPSRTPPSLASILAAQRRPFAVSC